MIPTATPIAFGVAGKNVLGDVVVTRYATEAEAAADKARNGGMLLVKQADGFWYSPGEEWATALPWNVMGELTLGQYENLVVR